jgi:HEAT repeat protein
MFVLAFDRDWTVDVNPHPNREAVPLEWVRHLAHETDHVVYAIGNQLLADEAAIPGVVDIVGRHSDEWEQWLGEKQPDGYYDRFPTRRERLALIADLHPDADGYVVVDDIDLSDVDGWDHYHAWEFVPAVERGDIDPGLPWVRDPVPDGGYPTSAGIVPVDASDLSSFLDEYSDAPAFELTYTDGGEESTDLLWNVARDTIRAERQSAVSAFRCTPLTPVSDRFTVDIDAIEMLSVVDPPPEAFTARTETPVEEATALRRLADVKPETVRVSSILSLLDRDDPSTLQQRDALRALHSVATVRPDECTPAIPILRSLLGQADVVSPHDALATLSAIAKENPAEIAPATDDIIPYLDSNRVSARREDAVCLAAIAAESPNDAVDAVPGLATIVEDSADGQQSAIYALERIAREFPEAVTPVAEPLGAVIVDESLSDNTRMSATAALGRAVNEFPSLAVDIIDDVARLFEADNYKLRNNAIALTFEVAAIHTDVVEPYVDDIVALVTVDDAYTRTNASGTLARVAEDFPDSVEHVTPTVIDLLTDDDPTVRENACWILGYLRATEAQPPLETRIDDDTNQDVRTRAAWALSQIESG